MKVFYKNICSLSFTLFSILLFCQNWSLMEPFFGPTSLLTSGPVCVCQCVHGTIQTCGDKVIDWLLQCTVQRHAADFNQVRVFVDVKHLNVCRPGHMTVCDTWGFLEQSGCEIPPVVSLSLWMMVFYTVNHISLLHHRPPPPPALAPPFLIRTCILRPASIFDQV